ncbi:MAG TPA: sigma 54-interacting transcriptional regulator [Thermoanaerobaculia bacterium]|nr:sigma 54-interacting transcriptional regulator [Thermoanaerobaculia bacterium]HUM30898.1 sigma 54-interacting transcriptional regulator [Thermoanaerobaculia bacterium]HXK69208.1 sigma 54-interacting transcriptional regulator [Thermoanaerobaculia bacterium]
MPFLVYTENEEWKVWSIPEGQTSLGRDDSADLILRSNHVSRNHCALSFDKDGPCIEDLGSKNGTIVNDQKIDSVYRLRDGDVLRLGDVILVYMDEISDRFSIRIGQWKLDRDTMELSLEKKGPLGKYSELLESVRKNFPGDYQAVLHSVNQLFHFEGSAFLRIEEGTVTVEGLVAGTGGLPLSRAYIRDHLRLQRPVLSCRMDWEEGSTLSESYAQGLLLLPLPGGYAFYGVSREVLTISPEECGLIAEILGLCIRSKIWGEEVTRLRRETELVNRQESNREFAFIGSAPSMVEVLKTMRSALESDATILITGESGTGKGLLARMIHSLSPRRDFGFVAINCSAIPDTLFEAEMFGTVKGAATDVREREGYFILADRGTLFLDEISNLSPAGQAKLLKAIEEKWILPVGATIPRKIDTRILVASNANLKQLVDEKKFRNDLYYRLNILELAIPPLRERREDILLLADYFLKDLARQYRQAPPRLDVQAARILESYPWPGNVRELRNIMERLVLLFPDHAVQEKDLSPLLKPVGNKGDVFAFSESMSWKEFKHRLTGIYLEKILAQNDGNIRCAAKAAGMTYRNFLYLLDKQKKPYPEEM